MSDLKIYLKKAAKLPLKILIKKIYQKIDNKIYYSMRAKKIAKNPINMDSNIFESFEPTINFLFDINNKKERYIQELKKSGKEEQIIEQADKICNHNFNLLGSGDVNLGKDIKWNEDFKTGFAWENKFYKKIERVNLNNSADVKIPWELSRFQHIPTLGQAYFLTNNLKYALEFKGQIEDWIKKNPVEMSVNWTCTMDVAIRACNWILGYYFFKNCPKINSEFWIKFNKALYLHGKFIFNNLEKATQYNGNHYLSDLAGLIWLGLYFKNFKYDKETTKNNPKIWLNFGLKEFEEEMKNQVNPDGVDYEASTAYHCLVTELFLFTSMLCSKNNIAFSKKYMTKLEKMIEFIMNISKPDGHIPLIGDMDSGRFIILSDYGNLDKRDFRYLIALGGEYFNRDDFKCYSSNNNNNHTTFWCLGNIPKIKTKEKSSINLKSKAYKDSGYYILRNDKIYIIIKCGPNGMNGNGGHTHNDVLSFELNVNGKDLIIDPGTYNYTGDYKMRNLFRSSAFHNTVVVDGEEINRFDKKEVFQMKDEARPKVLRWDSNENYDIFEAEHYGYKRLKNPVIHNREIRYYKKERKIKIRDKFRGEGKHKLQWNLILSVKAENDLNIYSREMNWHKEKAFYSPAYGVIKKTKKFTFIIETTIPYQTEFEILFRR